MIRFWPENEKPSNAMSAEKAKGHVMAMPGMAMPETLMPEKVKPGKIIGRPERRTPMMKCRHQGTQEETPLYRTGMMKPIPSWKEPDISGILWENVSEKDACRNETRGTDWTEYTCPR